ncbi:MAG: N-acetylneuraminate synthase family protein, partial [Candidatus Poribacteria bacterium]|nr:N-acetylneuraminate synthase family protein [Candidatus Poribacteria bacterium]
MSKKIFIIAEAGVNHNGNLEIAHQLVDVASVSGADAIKFQSFQTNELVTVSAPKAAYQTANV